jgi:3-oxoacyl-[acyl-carrier-protein] synthase II
VGNDCSTAWENVREGRSGIDTISSWDTTEFQVHFAGEVRGFDGNEYFGKRQASRIDLFGQYAMFCADQAVQQAGLDPEDEDIRRVGAYIGTGIGGLHTIEDQIRRLIEAGPRRCSPLMIPKLMTNAAAGMVSLRFGLMGPSMAVSSACASAANAIGEAFQAIQNDRADVIFAGGSEAAITPVGIAGFQQAKALSTRNEEPQKASRPFDADRDGFVMGEGAAVLIMEELEHARERGAQILAEVIGYGGSSDAHHITLPEPEGRGARLSMVNALENAGIDPDDVDYINAHGTSTPSGDAVEAKAIHAVFGDYAPELAISSSKSIFGHLLGASGALESAVCVWALQDGICPPTINLDTVDPECGNLNFVPNEAQEREIEVAMSNSFGFGGHNVSLILRKFTG